MDQTESRHLEGLRDFIRSLVSHSSKARGCSCHQPPSLLLVGPPGVGKTYLVKQIKSHFQMALYGLHCNQISSPLEIQRMFEQAKEDYPSIVFLDDLHYVCANQDQVPSCPPSVQAIRREIFNQLGARKLKIVDPRSKKNPTGHILGGSRLLPSAPLPSDEEQDEGGAYSTTEEEASDDDSMCQDHSGIIVVAATSSPWLFYKDHELLSRFKGVYLVGLPDKQTRYLYLKSFFRRQLHHNLTDPEVLLIAEKTEGFTVADLLVLVRELCYRQYAMLHLASKVHDSDGSSSQDTTGSSSDFQSPASSESSEEASDGKKTPVRALTQDWESENENQEGKKDLVKGKEKDDEKNDGPTRLNNEKGAGESMDIGTSPTSLSEMKKLSGSASSNNTLTGNIVESPDQDADDNSEKINKLSETISAPLVEEKVCYSSSVETDRLHCDKEESVMDKSSCPKKSPIPEPDHIVISSSNEKFRELEEMSFELFFQEPPDPVKNDNEGGAESDSEDKNILSIDKATISFSDMGPLSIDISGVAPPNISLDDFTSPGSSILKSLLSSDTHGHGDDSSDKDDLLRSLSPRKVKVRIKDDLEAEARVVIGTFLSEVENSLRPSAPTPANLSPSCVTPTPSDVGSFGSNAAHASSSSSSSSSTSSSDNNKKDTDESNSSFENRCIRGHSDESTATCNETVETAELRTDSEDGFHNNAESEQTSDVDDVDGAVISQTNKLERSLQYIDINDVPIITLVDVLDVISGFYKSVSDEDVKKYSEFMTWFPEVAKSACPHTGGQRGVNKSTSDDLSSSCTTPSLQKKKKSRKLRKLGRFILEALVLMLD